MYYVVQSNIRSERSVLTKSCFFINIKFLTVSSETKTSWLNHLALNYQRDTYTISTSPFDLNTLMVFFISLTIHSVTTDTCYERLFEYNNPASVRNIDHISI